MNRYTNTTFCPVHDKPSPQLLGKGGHGVVVSIDDNTVLKCIPIDREFVNDKLVIKKKLQEAKLLKKMHTVAPQRFVQLHNSRYDKADQCVKLTMERCEMDVHALMTTKPSALIDGLKENILYYQSLWVEQCLEMLHVLKQQGVYHLDIKPANIVITPGSHHLKLTDFGLSRFSADDIPSNLNCVITHWYRPPEFFCSLKTLTNEQIYTADWWAMACTLYEFLYFFGTGCESTQSLFSSNEDVPDDENEVIDPNDFSLTTILQQTSEDQLSFENIPFMTFQKLVNLARNHKQTKEVIAENDSESAVIPTAYRRLLNQMLQYDYTKRLSLECIQKTFDEQCRYRNPNKKQKKLTTRIID